MDDERVEELRHELRHKRALRFAENSGSVDGNAGGADSQAGTSFQTVRREGGETDRAYRPSLGDRGSGGEGDFRDRSSDRRSFGSNGSLYDGTPTPTRRSRRAGRIEADDAIPLRDGLAVSDEAPVADALPGKKAKQTRKRTYPPLPTTSERPAKRAYFRVKTAPFTEAEVEEKREPLGAAITDLCKYLDEGLWYIAEDELRQPIWSDIDEEEMEKLLSMLLESAHTSGAGAATVNALIHASGFVILGGITAPRLMRTLKLLGSVQIKRAERKRIEKMRRSIA